MRVFAISGFSGTGKTSLIVKLVVELKNRGVSVGVIKSSKEDIGPPEGTDTYRHIEAGAEPVVLIGPGTTTFRHKKRLSPEELLKDIDTDFLLLEGFKSADVPRVFCIGDKEISEDKIPEQTYAIITWEKTDTQKIGPYPVLCTSEVMEIVRLIEEYATSPQNVKF